MAVAVRALTTASAKFGGTYTPAWPAGIQNNDVVYAVVYNQGGALTTPASGWTLVATRTWNTNWVAQIYRHVYTTGDVAPAWSMSGSTTWCLDYIAFSGVDTTTPEDATPGVGSIFPTTSVTFPTVNVASSTGGMILYAVVGPGTTSTVTGTGLTPQYDDSRVHILTATQSTYGTPAAPTGTFSASQSSVNLTDFAISIRAAGISIYQFGPASAVGAATPAPGGTLVRDPKNTSWLPAKKPNALVRPSTAYLKAPCVFSRCSHYNYSASTTQLTSRIQHIAMFEGTDLILTYGNVTGVESIAGLGPLTLTAVIEIPFVATPPGTATQTTSAQWPVTWGGQTSVTIPPGQYVKSDPIPLHIVKGRVYYERTFATVGTGNSIPLNRTFPESSKFEYSDSVTTTDQTPVANTIGNNASVGHYGAQAIEATPFGRALIPYVVLCGDSRMYGAARANGMSWADQVLELAGIAHLKIAQSTEQNIGFFGQPGTTTDSAGRKYRGRFLAGATDILSNYSINDISSGATFAQMQARTLIAANISAMYGARYHQTTIEPHTSSTDSFATANNQTPTNAGQETVRTQFNAWLRDGAPVNGTTLAAVATGDASGTTIRAGAYGHPITGIFDTAAAVEVTNGSGAVVWNPNTMTNDGLHAGDSGHNMIAAAFVTYVASHFAAAAA